MPGFDVIVIGGGHAGIEAACSAASMGCKVALITMDKNAIGRMSCNPAIGGIAKGHLVREIDALGGVMGKLADKTGIQFRMLNRSKGPSALSPRCQSDRRLYSLAAISEIEANPNIEIVQESITGIAAENKSVTGVITTDNKIISAKAVVLCSGTFLNGLMHTGLSSVSGGRFGEQPATGITDSLLKLGFESGRLKTGTPPRLHKDSIDWSVLEEQKGDDEPVPFSFRTDRNIFPQLPQISCYLTYTYDEIHKILEKGFKDSPLFTGLIKGVGPRYCPSIEDKIVRFADKTRHQLFLEPEGLDSDLIYVNGFSTSLPAEIQFEALHKIKGLEDVIMVRPGYAVEYDYFPPHQVDLTLETKLIKGLYFAGQINGTSGYEEAAAQGLAAGINAAAKILGLKELVLKRNEAYIGVLIDDLVGKSTDEPYRMFTSRAEYRLLLRADNADRRLSAYGNYYKLISDDELAGVRGREETIKNTISFFSSVKLQPADINPVLEEKSSSKIEFAEISSTILKRPEVRVKDIVPLLPAPKDTDYYSFDEYILEQAETEIKSEGYIKRQNEQVQKMLKYEDQRIPPDFDYSSVKSFSTEAREKLARIKPRSIAQASRISGVSPSDISILMVYIKK